MLTSTLVALAGSLSLAFAQNYKGFNYGATNTDNTPKTEQQYQDEFTTAQNLVGATGFASARLYTMIQAGSANDPTQAIQAAINTKTSLLLGLWGSGGQVQIDNELAAFNKALSQYGTAFTDLIVGISVGSEDLYRISPTGIENMSGIGAGPDVISNYISQVRSALSGTAAASKPIGHVDTWTVWVNGSNIAVIKASDFIGMDAYPYFQTTMTNPIENGYSLFFDAYDATVSAVGNKPVWVTETGWPISGPTENQAVPSLQNAKTYWDAVGCGRLFGKVNTWWYTLQDAFPTTPSPSFGVVGTTLSNTPLYDLSCSGASASPASNAAPRTSDTASTKDGVSEQAGAIAPTAKIGAGREAAGQVPGADSASSSGTGSGQGVAPVQASSAASVASIHPMSSPAAPEQSGSSSTAEFHPVAIPPPKSTALSTKAVTITSCFGGCPKETHVQPTATAATPPSTLITKTSVLSGATQATASASSCPVNLSGNYEYPHLIVPINKDHPDTAEGTSYNGTVSSAISSIFNFDIPTFDAGKTCTLVFLLPAQSDLTTSAFTLSGSGGFDVARLTSPANESTSYSTRPSVLRDFGGPSTVAPGNEYVIYSGPCSAGQRVGFEVSATGDFALSYFQDSNPSPIGFYVTVC